MGTRRVKLIVYRQCDGEYFALQFSSDYATEKDELLPNSEQIFSIEREVDLYEDVERMEKDARKEARKRGIAQVTNLD